MNRLRVIMQRTSGVTRWGRGGGHPWGLVGPSIMLLLLAISVVAIIGVVANERVKDAAERGISYDVEIEDEGDDLHVAVLNLRHYHRNIVFGGPSAEAIQNFDAAYLLLLEELDELEELGLEGLDVPQPAQIRQLADEYHRGFRPSIVLFWSDPESFVSASNTGLARLADLESSAERIDDLGEQLTSDVLGRIEQAALIERLILLSLLGGVALVGVSLVIAGGRVVSRLAVANAHEQESRQRLAAALQSKNDLIADASHELRTPLTVIRGNAELALSGVRRSEELQVIEEIHAEASRMGRLVEDLLFLAQSETGPPPIEREFVPVHWLVSRLGPHAESLARNFDRCLESVLEGSGYVSVDPDRIQQAVLILVDNAAKHTPEGSCIQLLTRTKSDELAIQVIDAGPGIPPDEVARIFDRFYQVGERRERKRRGAGLGLAIARTIVEAHGGTIAVTSELEVGTTATIQLPLEPEFAADADPE